jgi:hypothetical protein
MATVVRTFNYTGTLQQATVPPGTTSIDVHLWGGAGGGGGGDRGGVGAVGAAGHYVTATSIAISSAQIGQTMNVAVGGGGGGGSNGTAAPGGANGKSITGYSGGRGGQSGKSGRSGSGGGAGGATVVQIGGTDIAVAGGGAGGGGAGISSNGTAGINTNSATANTPGTLGENGAGKIGGDGGGAGAGGGGADGGRGGDSTFSDSGASGGYSGSNNAAGGTESNGSGVTPGGTGSQYYTSGVAVAGGPASPGADGKAVVIFNIGVQAETKVGGAWKSINSAYVKVSGAWKRITAGYVKIGGVWKALFNSGVNFIETAAGFGDATGGTTSGTLGTGGGGCFIAGTMITMADGSRKPVEQVDIGDTVSVGGKVFATGKFLIDNLYDYNGIQVSGTHMVKEDGKWTRVEDSRLGRSLGDDEHIVYVFGNENRRIIINDTEFTDYFELSEQQELANHGEQFFSNWQDHDRQIHDKNVNILNA